MGLFLKTGAGRRLRKYRIHINDRILQLGLPGNLARDLPHSNILGEIDLNNASSYDKNDNIKITYLMWDYCWPVWKNLGDRVGFLDFSLYIKKYPVETPCGTLEEVEELLRYHFKRRYPEGNEWEETPPSDYQVVNINGRDWLQIFWPGKNSMTGNEFIYYLPLNNQHLLHFRFKVGFGEKAKRIGKKYYEQALNDMERIRDSVKLIEPVGGKDQLRA